MTYISNAGESSFICCPSINGTGVSLVETKFGGIVVTLGDDEITTFATQANYEKSPSLRLASLKTATVSRKGLIRVFRTTFEGDGKSVTNNTEIKNWAGLHTGPVTDAGFDATGELLATGSTDFAIRVWSVSGGYATHNFKALHRNAVTLVRFNPLDSSMLCSADASGEIVLWDLNAKTGIPLRNHLSAVTDVGFVPNFGLVSVGRDHIISIWTVSKRFLTETETLGNAAKKKTNKKKSSESTASVEGSAKKSAISASLMKTVPAMESLEGMAVLTRRETNGEVQFVTCGTGGYLKRWKFTPGDRDCQVVDSSLILSPKDKPLSCLSLSRDEAAVMVVDEIETSFSFRSTSHLSTRVAPSLIGFDDEINDLAFLGSPSRVLAAANSGVMRVYDLEGGGGGDDHPKRAYG